MNKPKPGEEMDAQDFEKILDVPYYSQFTEVENSELSNGWSTKSCGILCLKMVMDYWHDKSGIRVPELHSLVEEALKLGAYDSEAGGWTHDGLVRTAEHFGFVAWRRKWLHSDSEVKLFQQWGWLPEAIKLSEEQTAREGVATLDNSIVRDIPVIVSVPKEFNEVHKRHLIVLTGVRKDPLDDTYHGFYINDPYNPSQETKSRDLRKDEFVDQARFINNWNRRAIFVVPKDFEVETDA